MPFFHIFLTISAILGVSAIPFPVRSNDRSISYGLANHGRPTDVDALARVIQDLKIQFSKYGGVAENDRQNTKDEVLRDFHIFFIQNPASAKMTKLAHVPEDWVYLHDRQSLEVHYHEGMSPDTPDVDGGDRTIYRGIPPEKPLVLSFNRQIQGGEKHELTGLITEYHNAHSLNSPYRRAVITRVGQGWRPGGGKTDEIRDHVKFSSHTSKGYSDENMIGEFHIIRRPLTVSFGNEVDEGSRDLIEQKVREHHESMDSANMAKPSNVALVVGGSYKNAQGKNEAQAGYYEFPDCPKSQDDRYVDHGRHPVALE